MIRFRCGGCGWVFRAPDADEGRRHECPGCGESVVVPRKGARARSVAFLIAVVGALAGAGAGVHFLGYPIVVAASVVGTLVVACLVGRHVLRRGRGRTRTPAGHDAARSADPAKGPPEGARRAAAGKVALAAASVLVLGALFYSRGPDPGLLALVYVAAVGAFAAFVLRSVLRKRRTGREGGAGEGLRQFVDAYPDRTPREPESEETADACPGCGDALAPGTVVCGRCGVVCFFCGGRAEGRAGRDSYLTKCPRCGGFWAENSLLHDYWRSVRRGRLRLVFTTGTSRVGEFTEADPLCERDVRMMEDGWSVEQVLDRRRDGPRSA